MVSRTVAFAGSAVRIETSGVAAADVVDFLFRHIPQGQSAPPHVTFRVATEGDWLALSRDGLVLHARDSPAAVAGTLLNEVTHALIDASRAGLVLHAAALHTEGLALLLPGRSGSGKTTLTFRLAARGLAYLTDELVCVPPGSSDLEPFTRPLVVKKEARTFLDDAFDSECVPGRRLNGEGTIMVSPAGIRTAPGPACRPALLVFPRLQPCGRVAVERLSKAQAGMTLMSCLVNARNLPAHGFGEASRLARQVAAYRVTCWGRDHIDETVHEIVALCEEALIENAPRS